MRRRHSPASSCATARSFRGDRRALTRAAAGLGGRTDRTVPPARWRNTGGHESNRVRLNRVAFYRFGGARSFRNVGCFFRSCSSGAQKRISEPQKRTDLSQRLIPVKQRCLFVGASHFRVRTAVTIVATRSGFCGTEGSSPDTSNDKPCGAALLDDCGRGIDRLRRRGAIGKRGRDRLVARAAERSWRAAGPDDADDRFSRGGGFHYGLASPGGASAGQSARLE